MKKHVLFGTLILCAFSFGSCIEDVESESVTKIREAKAEALLAEAELSKAQAEAALIQARAEAAFKEAETAYKAAEAALLQAQADDAQFQLQKAKEQYEIQLAQILLQAELDLLKLQDQMEDYKVLHLAKYSQRVRDAFDNYASQVNTLNLYNIDLISLKADLAKLEAGILSSEAANKLQIMNLQKQIDDNNVRLEVLNKYKDNGNDKDQFLLQATAKEQEYEYQKVEFAKDKSCDALLKANVAYSKGIDDLIEQAKPWDELNSTLREMGISLSPFQYDNSTYHSVYEYAAVTYDTQYKIGASHSVTAYINLRENAGRKAAIEKQLQDEIDRLKKLLGSKTDTHETLIDIDGRPGQTDYTKLRIQEKALENATKALAEAEDSIKRASNKLNNAKTALDTADKNVEAAQKELEQAQEAYNAAVEADEDATEALELYYDAYEALSAALDMQAKAKTKYDDAFNELWGGKLSTGSRVNGAYYDRDKAKEAVEAAQTAIFAAQDQIEARQLSINNAEENQKKYNEAYKAFSLKTYNESVTKVESLKIAFENADKSYNEAKKSIEALYSEAQALKFLANNYKDVEKEIAELEKENAELQERIAGTNNSSAEIVLQRQKDAIAAKESQIAAQEKIVEQYKKIYEDLLKAESEMDSAA